MIRFFKLWIQALKSLPLDDMDYIDGSTAKKLWNDHK